MTEKIHYIGIDLGGTRIRAGRFDANLEMDARTETLTLDEEGVDAVIGRMVAQARAVFPTDGGRVAGIGVSAPGPIDPKAGVITSPPNLKGWKNIELRRILQEALGAPVFLGNDANLAALAEHQRGAGRGYTDLIYLTISTGVGAGVITDGRLLIGSHGFGAECGHLIMLVEGEHVSTLEKEAAGPSIARHAVAAIKAGEQSAIITFAANDLAEVTAKHVSEAARQGDPLALRLMGRTGKIIGCGIVSLLHTFNPQIVVIGGGVYKGASDLLNPAMNDAIRAYSIGAEYWRDLVIAPAALGEDVCLIGAAALAVGGGN
ncbi:MAG TPA: ROK family protein [Aggregatilineales bacterium]|nr:ROK family protein [Anaerolineales bacterium]HRE48036.1 ROK family protein [Aggregatilineales bacterium]